MTRYMRKPSKEVKAQRAARIEALRVSMKSNDLSMAAWKRVAKALPTQLHGYAREWAQAVERMEAEGTDSAVRTEWDLWRSLCAALEGAGVVTAADLKASIRDSKTSGCRLLLHLRAWGYARAAITKASKGEG